MSYSVAPFDTLGLGLNLRDKADAVQPGEAIDCLNVEYTERGAVKQRQGYTGFTQTTLTNPGESLHAHYRAGTTPQLLVGCGTRLEALDNSGSVVSSATGLTDGTWDFVRFGTPNSEVSYAGNGIDLLQSWDGSAWASVSNTPKAGALAVMAVSNRMVAGRFGGTTGGPTGGAGTSSPSHVYFSDAGSSTAWTTNNFVQLTPGDGEKVQAVVAWREFVFVFKESKYFIFYGEATASDGNPIFDYRAVDAGVGCASPRAVAVAEHGVYFLDRTGVYLTNGGEPTRVSDLVNPIFLGGSSDYYLGGELAHLNIENCSMTYHDKRLYLSFPTSSANNRTLVYDPTYEWWSLWDIPAAALLSFRPSAEPVLFFAYSGHNEIGNLDPTFNYDVAGDGSYAAINSRWRSGWFDYDQPEVKSIRESKVWGAGYVQMAIARDFNVPVGTLTALDFSDPSADTWGGTTWGGGTWSQSPALIARLRRRSTRGAVFSTYFENAHIDTTWAVHRVHHHLREARIPSVRKGIPA